MKLGKNLFPLSTLPHSAVGRASLHPLRFPNWVGQPDQPDQPDQVTTLQLLSCLFLASCQPDRLPTLLVKREIWEAGGWVVRKRGKQRGSNTTSNLTLLAPLPPPPVVNMWRLRFKRETKEQMLSALYFWQELSKLKTKFLSGWTKEREGGWGGVGCQPHSAWPKPFVKILRTWPTNFWQHITKIHRSCQSKAIYKKCLYS